MTGNGRARPTIALHSHSFTPQIEAGELGLAEVAHFYRELGVEIIELADAHVQATGPAEVRRLLDDLGMTVVCYDVVADFVTNDAAARRTALDDLRAGLERAAAVGSAHVLTYPGRPRAGVEPTAVRGWFAEALRACAPRARELGVTITIPDVGVAAELSGTSAHLNEICDLAGPEVRVTYDIGNFLLAGEDPLEALERLYSRIAHVHLKDWQVFPAGTAPPPGSFTGLDGQHYLGLALGEGVLDVVGVLRRLDALGYDRCLSIEYEGTGEPAEAMRRGLRYLRELLSPES